MRHAQTFFILAVLCIFVSFPQSTNAQTTRDDTAYRTYLLEIIELLQQQIQELTAARSRAPASTVSPFTSFLLEDEDDVVKRYILRGDTFVIDDRVHREYIERFLALTPDTFDLFFKEAVIFDGTHNFDAFVETIAPYKNDTWRFALHADMLEFRADSDGTTELLIHEFAHIGSYDSIPGMVEPSRSSCHDYFTEIGCPPTASYLNAFTKVFWSTQILDVLTEQGTISSEYSKRQFVESFVSDYAATSPAEDFAESFTTFVIENKPTGTLVKDKKVQFFYLYPELVTWRSEIRSNM
jgi:hypothetical protein